MRRTDFAPALAAGGGLVLFVSLFLNWYQPGLSAWTVFEVLDLVLAALALAVVVMVGQQLFAGGPARPGSLPAIGLTALVIVISQLINHPPAAQGASPLLGAWLGLAGAALMAVGGLLSVAEVSLSFPARERREPAGEPRRATPVPRRGQTSPANEAAAVEPEVQDELYPESERRGPIGTDDPELWAPAPPASEDETLPFDHESDERT